jgi:hypothetical protein
LAQKLEGLVRSALRRGTSGDVVAETASHFPKSENAFDIGMSVFGLLLNRVLRVAGLDGFAIDLEQPGEFARRVSVGAKAVFTKLRFEADRSGDRDVLKQLSAASACRDLLHVFTAASVLMSREVVAPRSVVVSRSVPTSRQTMLRMVTWNVSGMDISRLAPTEFGWEDKAAILCSEVLRWAPGVCGLQECPSALALDGLLSAYAFVGAQLAKTQGSYVHAYVRLGTEYEVVELPVACPAVMFRLKLADLLVDVAVVHE